MLDYGFAAGFRVIPPQLSRGMKQASRTIPSANELKQVARGLAGEVALHDSAGCGSKGIFVAVRLHKRR